jgi:hypothetical protein
MKEDYDFRLYHSLDIEKEIESIRKVKRELTPEKAKGLLYETGMYTLEGKLKPEFR